MYATSWSKGALSSSQSQDGPIRVGDTATTSALTTPVPSLTRHGSDLAIGQALIDVKRTVISPFGTSCMVQLVG